MNRNLKKKEFVKRRKGITLIALVITIIVLLILAGISISMLAGDNSILNSATEAKRITGEKSIAERVQLAYMGALAATKEQTSDEGFTNALTAELNKEFGENNYSLNDLPGVTIDEVQYGFDGTVVGGENSGGVTPTPTQVAALPTDSGTKPYLPSSSYKQLLGTDLSAGLVITDATNPADTTNPGNEYVWIEVPNDGSGPNYSSVTGPEDCTNIEEALIAYSGFAKTGSDNKTTRLGWKDEWYDGTSHTYDGTKWYDYNGTENTSYSGNINDKMGCGLTYSEYTILKQKMLKSIYRNGGFWIGRYEAGINIARGSHTSIDGLQALSKVNAYPFNYVTCSEAQQLATRVAILDANNSNNYSSSLMFGVQWDLVIKHLENKGVTNARSDSGSWGNHRNKVFNIDRGKYGVSSPWNNFIDYIIATENKVTVNNGVSRKVGTTSANRILLTTGASETNCKKNIYDLSGNVYEWTLEHATSYSKMPYARRGGNLDSLSSKYQASCRDDYYTTYEYGSGGRF